MKVLNQFVGLLLLGFCQSSFAAIIHTTDFINDSERDLFSSFENIPITDNSFYAGGTGPYVEGGIAVQQVNNNNGTRIWTTFGGGMRVGSRLWYPNGGDNGYTMISLADGSDFGDLGLLVGTGSNTFSTLYYELWNDGNLVSSGSESNYLNTRYFGIEGGGFDTLLIRNGAPGSSFYDRSSNALAIDAIEVRGVAVSEPLSIAMFGLGILGMSLYRRQNKLAS